MLFVCLTCRVKFADIKSDEAMEELPQHDKEPDDGDRVVDYKVCFRSLHFIVVDFLPVYLWWFGRESWVHILCVS